MSISVGGSLGAMPAPSREIQAYWGSLRNQITPSNSVIVLDGHDFRSMSDVGKQWISTQYSNILLEPTIYVQDYWIDWVLLVPAQFFLEGSTYMPKPANVTTLVDNSVIEVRANFPIEETLVSRTPIPSKVPSVISAKIPRPPNAFILYRKDHHESVKAAHPNIHNNQISVLIGKQWQQENLSTRAQYKARAAQLKMEHKQKHPSYQYQPRKTSEIKRRRTKKIAEALTRAQNTSDIVQETPQNHDLFGPWSKDYSTMLNSVDKSLILNDVAQHNAQQFSKLEEPIFADGSETPDYPKMTWGVADEAAADATWQQFINPQVLAGPDLRTPHKSTEWPASSFPPRTP